MERQRARGSHRETSVQRENRTQRIKPDKRLPEVKDKIQTLQEQKCALYQMVAVCELCYMGDSNLMSKK